MDSNLEFSYTADLYGPPSPSLWSGAAVAAGPRPLAWKLNGTPPASTPQQHSSPSFRRAEGPSAGALSASRPSAAPAQSKPFAAAGKAALFTAAAAPDRGAQSAVLGAGVAGYTSVVTKNPVSPSGYAVPVQPTVPAQQQQQQQRVAGPGSIHMYGDPQLLSASYTQSSGYAYNPSSSSSGNSSSAYSHPGAPASAAAAALAALAGSHSRTSSAPAGNSSSTGSYVQQYAAKNYTPPQIPASTSGSRGSMLLWNIKQPPPQAPIGQPSSPVAGRRAATAGMTGQMQRANTPSYGAGDSSGSSGNGSRPTSQEGSPGLAKLKQLSTARLVRRLGTPPAASQHEDSIADSGCFGARPAASVAAAGPGSAHQASPTAGRRAAPAQQQQQQQVPLQQVQQQWQQPQQQRAQAPQRQQTQQTRSAGALGRPTDQPTYRRSSSSNGSSFRGHAQTHPFSKSANSSKGSGSAAAQPGFISRMLHGFSGSAAAQAQPPLQLPPDAEYVEVDRQPCPSCGRCFAPQALQQHIRICDKVFCSKRKAFDVKAQRLQGTGAAAAAGRAQGSSAGGRQPPRGAAHDKRPAVSAAQAKKSKWQMQSEQLRAAMRASRPQASGSGASGWGGPPPQMEEVEDNRVECPHCGRRFAELVAERHIPKCSDIIAKPTRLKAAGGRAAYMRTNSRGR